MFEKIEACFDEALLAGPHGDALRRCSLLIGMHPDQATEPIVDFALAHGKPFAVVPCCVFPQLFAARRRAGGGEVKTYEEFVEYLKEKDPSIRSCFLPFQGRNLALFRTVAAVAAGD